MWNKKRRNARIVCTIGPASCETRMLAGLIRNGMNVARLNFSHGDHATHRRNATAIREISAKYSLPVAILQDLQGVKIRVGPMTGGAIELKKGDTISILAGEGVGSCNVVYINHKSLFGDVKEGDIILLDDGLIQLSVTGRGKGKVIARVVEGGVLKDRKGVNFPGTKLSVESFTEKDREDLAFGIRLGVDYIAMSFVREARDIETVREFVRERNRNIPIIAKIEKREALSNIEQILSATDGIMIARGDLGVEMPPEEVPLIQKTLIDKANKRGKIVITATQMLESMTSHSRPTRAEATDVANAVIDGTDALMLSAETASGDYPLESLKMMDRIIRHTEATVKTTSSYVRGNTFAEATADAACRASEDVQAKVLVAFTQSGFTAGLVSKFRPKVPVIAFTPDEKIQRRACLLWGVEPRIMPLPSTTDAMIAEVERLLLKEGIVKRGDSIVITSSSPLTRRGKTNFMKLHTVGK